MKKTPRNLLSLLLALTMIVSITSCVKKDPASSTTSESSITESSKVEVAKVEPVKTEDGWMLVENPEGATLGYHPDSGVTILEQDGLQFKDLNKNSTLDPYEDWRLTADERAKDMAQQMTIEEIAGLMLYSAHTPLENAELTEEQIKFLTEDNVRAVLITAVESKATAAEWNNNAQALVEASRLGIPINSSSDPRNNVSSGEAYSSGDGDISMWPSNLGMAATFKPELMKTFGEIASKEYRALGIGTALSPQIDLATEPRWLRANGTFGEDVVLATEMTRAYADGFQTTANEDNGWGYDSVNAMIKHWPGDGMGEKGRESHLFSGKYAVYPGGNFEQHLVPFVDGGFKLDGATGVASAVMSSYSIAFDENKAYGELVGSGFSDYKITELLREKYGYDGVVCTDWLITGTEGITDNLKAADGLYQPSVADLFGGYGISWGMEYDVSVVERFYKVIQSGHDQFGGVNVSAPVLAAYELGVKDIGEEAMRARMEQSAVRLSRNIINLNLLENPYLNAKETVEVVGNADFMKAGYEAQLDAVIMLKNADSIISKGGSERKTVYVPQVYVPPVTEFNPTNGETTEKEPASIKPVLDIAAVEKYFDVVTDEIKPAGETATPEDIVTNTDFKDVDFALLAIDNPSNGGMFSPVYLQHDKINFDPAKGAIDNGIYPISLQYRPYTAPRNEDTNTTIATDPVEEEAWIAAGGAAGTSRSYAGKTTVTPNEKDLDLVINTKKAVGADVPVVVFIRSENAFVLSELEPYADSILLGFGVSDQAILEVISGQKEPSGLLPVQMPADMVTVEANEEDVAKDLTPYKDATGNSYDFGFGMNWTGPISDARTTKYVK